VKTRSSLVAHRSLLLALCSWLFALGFPFPSIDPDHGLLTAVLQDYVAEGMVDYKSIRADQRFDQYLAYLSETNPYEIKDESERLAFWINAYNASTIKLVIDHYPVESIRDIKQGSKGPWDIVWINIGGKQYSLNHIEHEIIRKEFDEPRIHMALVCAATSCPPLRSEAYEGSKLEQQLSENAKRFLSDREKNRYDAETSTLYLSEIFSWYGDDFNKKYGSAAAFALSVMGRNDVKPSVVQYLSYDWRLNNR